MLKLKSYLGRAVVLSVMLTTTLSRALTFNLIPEVGTPQFAIDAFTAAANRWSAVLADAITVNVQIGFSSLGPSIIGQAGSDFREFSYTETRAALGSLRVSGDDFSAYAALPAGPSYQRLINHTSNSPHGANSPTPYVNTMDRVGMTTANAKALGLLGATTSTDAFLRFNSDFGFDFNPSDGITGGQFDFVGVVTHELGHALGFVSGVDDIDQLGGLLPDSGFSSNLLDLFRYSTASLAAGAGITDYTADNRLKFFSVDGGATPLATFANGVVYGDGNQASHWKDFLGLGLMDPTVFPGELMMLSDADLRAFDALGYTLVPEPSSAALLLIGGMLFVRRRGHSEVAHTPS
jgi:hypothetical protein